MDSEVKGIPMMIERFHRIITPYLKWRKTRPDWSFSRDLFRRWNYRVREVAEILEDNLDKSFGVR